VKNSLVVLCVSLLIVACLTPLPCVGQTTSGEISGRVVDPDGQAIANARVTLMNQFNAETRIQATDSAGEFVFASVQPGTFAITVNALGF